MKEYYYLIASLPMLEFGTSMPFPYEYFLKCCEEQLCSFHLAIINRVSLSPCEPAEDASPILRRWHNFDMLLRNEIVRHRADRLSKDPSPYIRGENSPNPFLAGFAEWAVSQDSPLEAELSLDKLRWQAIEEFSLGHYFDIDFLVAYALKLKILERWDKINSEAPLDSLQKLIL